jgi:hypothetical protein
MTAIVFMAWLNIITGTVCAVVYLAALRQWRELERWKRMAVVTVLALTAWGVGGYVWVTLIDPTVNVTILRLLFSGWCVLAVGVNNSLATVSETTRTTGVEADLAACKEELEGIKVELARIGQQWEMNSTVIRRLLASLDGRDEAVEALKQQIAAMELQIREMERSRRRGGGD